MKSLFLHILFIFSVILFFACNSAEELKNNDVDSLNISSKVNQKREITDLNTDYEDDKDIDFVRGKSVIFFSLDKEEYNLFMNRMGKHNKWEFDIIYNNFKKTAKNALSPLKELNIKAAYITKKNINFITNKNDTLIFNRENEDYLVGQIFFNGIDSIYILEGLFKANDLEETISEFFNIEQDFNISAIVQVSDSFRYIKPDTNQVIIEDSLQ